MIDALESRDFYEVCQMYRHSLMGANEFEALKEWLRANYDVEPVVEIKPAQLKPFICHKHG